MEDVSRGLSAINPKQRLHVLREPAVSLLPKLFKAWNVTHLAFEIDTDAYGRERDNTVLGLAKAAGVEIIRVSGRTLYDSDLIVEANGNQPTMTINQLQAAGEKVGKVKPPLDAPTTLPDPGELNLDIEQKSPESQPDFNAKHREGADQSFASGLAGPSGDFAVPTLEELGMPAATTPHKGGESVALKMLDSLLAKEEYMGTFEKPKTSPAAFEPQSTCLTSPYLHFGALSVRLFYHKVQDLIAKREKEKKKCSKPPESLIGQLLFRDMYFAAQASLGYAFSQTYNNDHCRFIPWHLPSKVDTKTKLITGSYEVDDPEKEEWFLRWSNGTTGFPWIDAIMRQLRQEGWVHHLARHSVACFLTRGGAYISWERGAEVFEELLLDHETACNTGNWQWLSCTAFFSQFYRCYSPVAFGKKWDKNGDYIRQYVPELKGFPAKFIFEPHKAPIVDQKKAGVLIRGNGNDSEIDGLPVYPKPMFDFAERRDVCLEGMKTAYGLKLYGNSPKVMDGTWKALFDDAAEGPTKGEKGGPGGLDHAEGDDEELEDGAEEEKSETTPKKGRQGHKREASQTKIDFAKKRTKDS